MEKILHHSNSNIHIIEWIILWGHITEFISQKIISELESYYSWPWLSLLSRYAKVYRRIVSFMHPLKNHNPYRKNVFGWEVAAILRCKRTIYFFSSRVCLCVPTCGLHWVCRCCCCMLVCMWVYIQPMHQKTITPYHHLISFVWFTTGFMKRNLYTKHAFICLSTIPQPML